MGEWVDHIESATQDVFETMLGARLARLVSRSDGGTFSLTAIVSLAGTPSAVLGISCHTSSAAHMAMRMLGSARPEPDEYAKDALGEVCNMVAGRIQSRLSSPEDLCRLSVPTLISGKDYRVRSLVNGRRYEVCLDFEGRPFKISLEIHHAVEGPFGA